jgi:hypothetical protein
MGFFIHSAEHILVSPQFPLIIKNPYRDGWRETRDTRHSLYYSMTVYDRQANGGWTERRRSHSLTHTWVGGEKGWWQDSKQQAHWGDEKGWRDAPRSLTADGALTIMPAPATLRFILLCCLWYTSSALSSNTGKSIMLIFKFPVTLTFIQFGFIAGYCMLLASPLVGLTRIRGPSAAVLRSTIPMAAFQVGGHISSSFAISRIPVSTVHTIKVCIISDLSLKYLKRLSLGSFTFIHSSSIRPPLQCQILAQDLHLPPSADHRSYACMHFRCLSI